MAPLPRAQGDNKVMCKGTWVPIKVTVDSGAADSVASKKVAPHIPVRSTEMSRGGLKYSAACGTEIANEGERDFDARVQEGHNVAMTFQAAEVRKPLGAVSKICDANNRVVFDNDGSYSENKITKERTPIERNKGSYEIDLYVDKEENENNEMGFVGQGTELM